MHSGGSWRLLREVVLVDWRLVVDGVMDLVIGVRRGGDCELCCMFG